MNRFIVWTLIMASSMTVAFSDFSSAAPKQTISGRYSCDCYSGNTGVVGTCSVTINSDGSATCGKHAGDTCTATCKMVTFTHGVTGGAIAITPGAGGGTNGTAPAATRK